MGCLKEMDLEIKRVPRLKVPSWFLRNWIFFPKKRTL